MEKENRKLLLTFLALIGAYGLYNLSHKIPYRHSKDVIPTEERVVEEKDLSDKDIADMIIRLNSKSNRNMFLEFPIPKTKSGELYSFVTRHSDAPITLGNEMTQSYTIITTKYPPMEYQLFAKAIINTNGIQRFTNPPVRILEISLGQPRENKEVFADRNLDDKVDDVEHWIPKKMEKNQFGGITTSYLGTPEANPSSFQNVYAQTLTNLVEVARKKEIEIQAYKKKQEAEKK